MRNRIPASGLFLSRLLLAVLFCGCMVMPLSGQESSAQKKMADHNLELGKQLDIFNAVYRNLDLLYVDTLDPQQIVTAGIDGMLRSLDPYTEYYPESDTKDLKLMITGKYAGIGALIKQHSVLNHAVIDEPYYGMPAAEAGLRKGDVIISIDDTLMAGKSVSYVSNHLRGDAGTTFLLRYVRPDGPYSALSIDKKGRVKGGSEHKVRITRRNIKLPELPYYGMIDSLGYISLTQFTEDCAKEVRRAFVDLKKRGIKGLILDLRNNGGGSEIEAIDLLSIWLPKGITVVENRGKVAQANHKYETRYEPVDTVMPLAVLVNDDTASASEITAGALQDLDRGVVIGVRTYGKGLVQVPLDMPYNTNLKVTTSRYYIPSGRCIQAINYSKKRSLQADAKSESADSLANIFHTIGGREVRGGGGITPDLEVKADTMSNLAYYLSSAGRDSTEVLFGYLVDYISQHPTIVSPGEFHLSDADFDEFSRRVIESGFSYDPVSRKQFDELVKIAKFEGYYDDAKEAFDALSEKLKHDISSDIDKHKEELRILIEQDLVSAYYYQQGAIEHYLPTNKVVAVARRVLADQAEYHKLLSPKE